MGLVPETVLVFEPENYAVIHAPNVVVVVPNQGNTHNSRRCMETHVGPETAHLLMNIATVRVNSRDSEDRTPAS